MAGRIPKDSIDLAEMRDTIRSPGYRLIADRYADQHAAAMRELILADTWDKALRCQGRILAIERAMALPKIIEDEIRAKQRKNGVDE
jgi:hypothetical protein